MGAHGQKKKEMVHFHFDDAVYRKRLRMAWPS